MIYFALSIFISAFLLFQVQPIIGKLILPWFGGTPAVWSTVVLFFPVLLFIQIILIVGLNLVIATFNVFYRDVQYITTVVLMLLFYLTPVFYNPDALGDPYRFIYISNPIAILIGSYRAIFFYGSAPDMYLVLFAFLFSLALLVIGYFVYNHELSDVIDAI